MSEITYKEWINSEECAENARQLELHLEAQEVVAAYGSKMGFRVSALAGQFELAAHIAHILGLAPDIECATALIELCSKNDHRYGVCEELSLEAWCEDTFAA